MDLTLCPQRAQTALSQEPYDSWASPEGGSIAQFFRCDGNFLVRFPGRVDFEIDRTDFTVKGWPEIGACEDDVATAFTNSILPILGNHRGGLFLHGSAVCIDGKAVAFLGQSRSGKTTLAGALAKRGFPFLTEDVIELVRRNGTYWAEPKPSALRLFPDSAEHLLGKPDNGCAPGDSYLAKQIYDVPDLLPFSDQSAPLQAIFVLGADHAAPLRIRTFGRQDALAALLPHSFILDVEDKPRLRDHFGRLADLSEQVACRLLDYPRDYAKFPASIEALFAVCGEISGDD